MEGWERSAGGSSRTSAAGSERGGVPHGSVMASYRVKVESGLHPLFPPTTSLKLLRYVLVFFL